MLPVLTVVGATLVALVAGAILLRWQQVGRERELSQSWRQVGRVLDQAAVALSLSREGFPDAWEMGRAADDERVRTRLDSAEARIWRAVSNRRPPWPSADSLREVLRRARERQGLALADCRTNRDSWLGSRVLEGFPRR